LKLIQLKRLKQSKDRCHKTKSICHWSIVSYRITDRIIFLVIHFTFEMSKKAFEPEDYDLPKDFRLTKLSDMKG